MVFSKGHHNPFKSGSYRGQGPRRGFSHQRGRFHTTFQGKCGKEWKPPPQNIIPFGKFAYSCEGDLVCKVEIENIPYFSAPVYRDNRQQIGKIDEIFGNPRDYMVTIKLDEGMKASSFPPGENFFIDSIKLLPLARFLPKPKGSAAPGPRPKKSFPKYAGPTKNKKTGQKKRIGSFFCRK